MQPNEKCAEKHRPTACQTVFFNVSPIKMHVRISWENIFKCTILFPFHVAAASVFALNPTHSRPVCHSLQSHDDRESQSKWDSDQLHHRLPVLTSFVFPSALPILLQAVHRKSSLHMEFQAAVSTRSAEMQFLSGKAAKQTV